jgi:hypothetical protein
MRHDVLNQDVLNQESRNSIGRVASGMETKPFCVGAGWCYVCKGWLYEGLGAGNSHT